MRIRTFSAVLCFIAVAGLVLSPSIFAAPPDQILIGEPATLSGKHAKAGEQSTAGVEAIGLEPSSIVWNPWSKP